MNVEVKEAIEALTKKSQEAKTPEDAMKFSQAALNLAHVRATLTGSEALEKQQK